MSVSEPKKLDRDTRDELTELIEEITEEPFNEYLNSNNKSNEQYEEINERITLLNLDRNDNETLTEFKDIVMNKFKLTEHVNIISLLKTDDHLDEKFNKSKEASLKTNLLKYTEYKLRLLREFEKYYGLGPLNISAFESMDNFRPIDTHLFNNINSAFETKKTEPTDAKTTQQLYITMIKQLTSKNIIITTRSKTRGEARDSYMYNIDEKAIKYHIKLNSHSNRKYKNYHEEMINKYQLEAKRDEEKEASHDIFLD